jgi:ElaB/YqjD/DUF883 family membrane-anchored ribosome-binding protein
VEVTVSTTTETQEISMPDNNDRTGVIASANSVESLPTNAGPSRGNNNDPSRELAELQAELRDLRSALRRPPLVPSPTAAGAARTVREEVEHQIRLQPIASVALAAIVGFVYGIAR